MVLLDETHEMLINKDCKSAVIHPNKEFIGRKALYFPFRSKSISNFKNQVNPKNQENVRNLDLKTEMKSKENVHAMIIALDKSNALPSNPMGCATPRNGFTDINASPAQQHDHLSHREIGTTDFNSFAERAYLHKANAKAPAKLHRSKTFSTCKRVSKHQYSSYKRKKLVTKCKK